MVIFKSRRRLYRKQLTSLDAMKCAQFSACRVWPDHGVPNSHPLRDSIFVGHDDVVALDFIRNLFNHSHGFFFPRAELNCHGDEPIHRPGTGERARIIAGAAHEEEGCEKGNVAQDEGDPATEPDGLPAASLAKLVARVFLLVQEKLLLRRERPACGNPSAPSQFQQARPTDRALTGNPTLR
jgi:hypothetical protein